MKGLAASTVGLQGLWGKIGLIYRDKPHEFHEFHEFARIWDCMELFVLYYLTNFSPDGELNISYKVSELVQLGM